MKSTFSLKIGLKVNLDFHILFVRLIIIDFISAMLELNHLMCDSSLNFEYTNFMDVNALWNFFQS